MAEKFVGTPVTRVDAAEKVTGSAIYAVDLRVPGMLYGRVLRSPYAHARIRTVVTAEAERLPGVIGVVTGKDIAALGGEAVRDMPFLACDKVRYVGEPVAAVAAVREEVAEQAVGLITAEYEELPALFDVMEAAHNRHVLIHENLDRYCRISVVRPICDSNVVSLVEFEYGDVEKGFAASDYVFEDTFRVHRVQHGQVEPHCAIAQVGEDGTITVWTANSGPHRLRKDLSDALGLPLGRVRVIVPYVGGGFGGKGGLKAEPIAIALAYKTKPRPVKVTMTRDEVFAGTAVRHAAVITVKTGVTKGGVLLSREVTGHWDTGAYAEKGPTVVRQATWVAAGPYRIPNAKLRGYCVYTNNGVAGAYRGYGTPQVTWAYESQMDIIAQRLGIDPLEIRLKNIIREGDTIPWTGQQAMSVGLEQCLLQVARELRWSEACPPFHGKGIACTIKGTKTPSGSAAYVTLNQDGTVDVLVSTIEWGQGSMTILAQIAGEELGIPVGAVRVSKPDTSVTPFDASTTGSRSTFHMGNAVQQAARDVKVQLCGLAAQAFGVDLGEVAVVDGEVRAGGQVLSYPELLKLVYGAGGSVLGRGFYYSPSPRGAGLFAGTSVFWLYGAQGTEVEVDPQTGKISVLKVVAAHDVGRAINPVTCQGQIEGGVAHAIGNALFEEVITDRGKVINASFHDYKLPTAMDVPRITPIIVEAFEEAGPFGAKGVGEPVMAPTAAAIANAVDAAACVRFKELPLTPERLWKALRGGCPGQAR